MRIQDTLLHVLSTRGSKTHRTWTALAACVLVIAGAIMFPAPGFADIDPRGRDNRSGIVSNSSAFGIRRDPITNRNKLHKGIDLSRPAGTAVFAWSDGVVERAGLHGAYGNTVEVRHTNGILTRYAHLQTMEVRPGQHIAAGETLGQVGRTGRTTGANLHFEVLVNGRHVDPRKYINAVDSIVDG